MSASYPSSAKAFTTRENGVGQFIDADHINDLQNEVTAIENGLIGGLAHDLLTTTDDAFDLGSAAKSWRDLFVDRNALIGGTLGVTGLTTHTGALVAGDLRGTPETITATGTVADQAVGATTTILRCNNATALTIQGLTGGSEGRILIVESVGAGQVNLAHQNGSATAANRLSNFATSGNTPLAAGSGRAIYVYRASTGYWCLLHHEQGAWITATHADANYVAVGGGTFTVTSGDVISMRSRLIGRTLTVAFDLATTSIAGTVSEVNILKAAYGGFTWATGRTFGHRGEMLENATRVTMHYNVEAPSGGVLIRIFRGDIANLTASADNAYFQGGLTAEVA